MINTWQSLEDTTEADIKGSCLIHVDTRNFSCYCSPTSDGFGVDETEKSVVSQNNLIRQEDVKQFLQKILNTRSPSVSPVLRCRGLEEDRGFWAFKYFFFIRYDINTFCLTDREYQSIPLDLFLDNFYWK